MYNVGLIGGPAVMAHGRGAYGMASLGARMLVPPITSLVGALGACIASGSFRRACTENGMAVGFLFGSLGVSALDALVFSRPQGTEVGR